MTARCTLAPPPMPGLVWGRYPQRNEAAPHAALRRAGEAAQRCWQQLATRRQAAIAGLDHAGLARVRAAQARWHQWSGDEHAAALNQLRAHLARDGWRGAWREEALGCVAQAGARALGQRPHDSQLQAAAVLLDGGLAEMATGEGKTYAAALAAAVAALAGVPVHVMTANDYLVQRDASGLQPLFSVLGLRVGCVLAGDSAEQRRAAYACNLTYATAREVAFDYLRDHLGAVRAGDDLHHRAAALLGATGAALPAPIAATAAAQPVLHEARAVAPPGLHGQDAPAAPPVLRGLCMALLDEADSLLIDDAGVPLVLSEMDDDAAQRAACFQALALARQLRVGVDVQWGAPPGDGTGRRAAGPDAAESDATGPDADATHRSDDPLVWSAAGRARLDAWGEGLGGAWHNRRHRQNLVETALVALHRLQRDRHYLVRDGRIDLLDAQTGRVAEGRVLARALHTLVELKEGLRPSPGTTPRAQISVQRFFARYLHLAGMSGTLAECRHELAALYGSRVVRIPLRQPSGRRLEPDRLFADAARREAAVLARVRRLHARGQPVLVGVDSVAASERLSRALAAARLPHQVLNARHDADEARIVAAAGQRGAITVATQMAGRGTDIPLGDGVAALGGLHVLCCLDSAEPRLRRQLLGRCARQGDPGSAEVWHQLQAPAWAGSRLAAWLRRHASDDGQGGIAVPPALLQRWTAWTAHRDAQRRARQRRQTLEQDRAWSARLNF